MQAGWLGFFIHAVVTFTMVLKEARVRQFSPRGW